jgi:hypothetical protein
MIEAAFPPKRRHEPRKRGWRHVYPKRRYLPTKLQDITTRKITILKFTAVETFKTEITTAFGFPENSMTTNHQRDKHCSACADMDGLRRKGNVGRPGKR